jgi:hypothetical protein
MFKGNMERYDKKSRTHEPVTSGQAGALQGASYRTRGTSLLISSLLYTQAGLSGTITQIEAAQLASMETINGRPCHKITGTAVMILSAAQQRAPGDGVDRCRAAPHPACVRGHTEGHSGQRLLAPDHHARPARDPTIEDARFQFKVPS